MSTADADAFPRCLSNSADFPHREAILAALKTGATIRRDSRVIPGDTHFGTWSIRLRIARDSEIKGYEEQRKRQAPDIERFLENLKADLTTPTRAWFVNCLNGEGYTIIEDDRTG